MWTNENRGRYDRSSLRYPSDLTDEEWAHVAPLVSSCQARRQQASCECARGSQRAHVRVGMFPFLKKLFADGGYQGRKFRTMQKKALPFLTTEIVKRSDHAKGFEVLPRRWVVERTFCWAGRCRRLAKDCRNLN